MATRSGLVGVPGAVMVDFQRSESGVEDFGWGAARGGAGGEGRGGRYRPRDPVGGTSRRGRDRPPPAVEYGTRATKGLAIRHFVTRGRKSRAAGHLPARGASP